MTIRSSRRGTIGSKSKVVAGAFYVAPGGNDSTGTGTFANPYATITRGQTAVSAGGTVYLRGGTYSASKFTLSKSGSAGNVITYAAYPGETPVLDGTGATFATNDSICYIGANYVTLKGLTFANSPERGVSSFDTGRNNVVMDGLTIHDTQRQAILSQGDTMTVKNCLIYNACLINTSQALGTGGWPAALHINKKYPEATASTNIVVTGNTVHDCWGEGIDLEGVDGGTISRNKVYDCLSVLIYCDTSKNLTVTKNYLTVGVSTYNRTDLSGRPAVGIAIGIESSLQSVTGYTIANNIVSGGCSFGISFFDGGTGATHVYSGILVFHNTFYGTVGNPTVQFAAANQTPSGCELRNNIIYAGSSSTALSLNQSAAWTVTNNDWASGSLPSGVSGNGNITSSPGLVGTLAVGAAAEAFKLGSGASPCAGAGVATAVTDDYFGASRPNPPDIGFHEYV